MSVIKKLALILIIAHASNLLNAQQFDSVRFEFCEEMIRSKQFDILEFSLVVKGDTFPFPKIGQNTYLNPISFFSIHYTPSDTIYIIVENRKYVFSFMLDHRFMNFDKKYFCINRFNYRQKKYRYTMGGHLSISGPCKVSKK